jgi:hypothetical protein
LIGLRSASPRHRTNAAREPRPRHKRHRARFDQNSDSAFHSRHPAQNLWSGGGRRSAPTGYGSKSKKFGLRKAPLTPTVFRFHRHGRYISPFEAASTPSTRRHVGQQKTGMYITSGCQDLRGRWQPGKWCGLHAHGTRRLMSSLPINETPHDSVREFKVSA